MLRKMANFARYRKNTLKYLWGSSFFLLKWQTSSLELQYKTTSFAGVFPIFCLFLNNVYLRNTYDWIRIEKFLNLYISRAKRR